MKYTVIYRKDNLAIKDVFEGKVLLNGVSSGFDYGTIESDAIPEIGAILLSTPIDSMQTTCCLPPRAFKSLFTINEQASILRSTSDAVLVGWTDVLAATAIEPYGTTASTAMAALVTDGLLTQVRADEILVQAKAIADAGSGSTQYQSERATT